MINKKKQGGLYLSFLSMTLIPLAVMGLFIILAGRFTYINGLHNEVRNGLKSVAESVLTMYDVLYDGDYNLLVDEEYERMILKKGDTEISEDLSMLDRVREKTGVDVTLFFYDTRMVTTIVDNDGERVVGSTAHAKVMEQVIQQKEEHFFNNVMIDGKPYFADYIPIFGKDGTCIGMIGAAKPADEVSDTIEKALHRNLLIILLAVLLVALIIVKYTTEIVKALQKMMKFLGEVAEGNLDTKLDAQVLARNDEIGEMGKFTLHVQSSLKKLVERDVLTGLYNRRSGQNKLNLARENAYMAAKSFAVAIGDIDFFKKVNDTYGHEAGDEILINVARILNDGMAGRGFVARWGGEEFLLCFERVDDAGAKMILQDILQKIRDNVVSYETTEIRVTMSFGIVTGDVEMDLNEQLAAADKNLYYAKEHGRNRIVIDQDIEDIEN